MRLALGCILDLRMPAALLLVASLAGPARAADALPELASLLRPLEAWSRTGVLYDRVLPLAHLEQLDGSPAAPVMDRARWRQAYDELRRAALTPGDAPDLATVDAAARDAARDGTIPLALIDGEFDRVRPGALADGSLALLDGQLVAEAGTPLVSARAIAAVALAPRTYHGAGVTFVLDAARCFAGDRGAPSALWADFADGLGERPLALGGRVRVHYDAPGPRVLRLRLQRADGSTAEARFAFDVAALAAPLPNDTLHVTATIPYKGQFGTGDAYVYLAPGHSSLVNPVIVSEGFDTDNTMNWDELYALLDQQGLIETLRSDGFDAVVLNYTDATVAIEQNAYVVTELLRQVQNALDPLTSVALVGPSMGGLCTRYALAYMETHGLPHRVRTWVSFDAPHKGADIPLGLQYWISYFASQSTSAAAFLTVLNRPAAREMLLYHLTTPPGTTGQRDPLADSLAASFAAVGNWPSLPHRVAVANGSGNMLNQGFLPGDQLIRYEYSSFLLAITGNVWAVPNASSHNVFLGSQRIVFSTTSQTVNVNGTLPWDGAPGGSRASMMELDTTAAPYGDIVALHPSHCFIPTISALSLPTNDPFFNVAGTPNLAALTPFAAVLYAATNEEHVTISATTAAWLRSQIEQGVLAVAPDAPAVGHTAALASPAPNPFTASTRVAFMLAREGLVALRVFDVRGRAVRVLSDGVQASGLHALAWDGRDERGVPAPAGIYFVRLEAAGQSFTRRVARLD